MDDFGRADVFTGASEIGQGSDTVIAQIVAEELGLRIEDVNIINNDTDVCPWDVGVHASRTTFVAGNAAHGAARKIKEQILTLAAREMEAHVKDLVLQDRKVFVKGSPDRFLPLEKILRKAHYSNQGQMIMADYFYDPANENLDREFKGNLSMTYAFGAHGVEVEVDEESGKVKILNYVAAHDVGRAINPMLLEGQVYGGVTMGVGYALTEQLILHKGEVMNPNFRDYKLLTCKDRIPIKTIVVETQDPDGPFGAKGIGEPGCVPTAPAIANAVYDAIGVRIKELPITPEKIVAALKAEKITRLLPSKLGPKAIFSDKGQKAMQELLRELKIKIVEELQLLDVNPEELADDTPFFDGGLGLYSVDLLVLVALLDRDYGVEIFTRELGEKVFINLSTLAAYIKENRKK